MKIEFDIIGTIHSPFKELEGMPIQPTGAKGIEGRKLEDINLDAVMDLLDMLKREVQGVKDGIRTRDHFISYTMKPEEMSSAFSKEVKASSNDERDV